LIVEHELAYRSRKLILLLSALMVPSLLARSIRRGSTNGFYRIGGRAEFVGGDMGDTRGLTGSVRGMPCCTTAVSRRAVCVAATSASLAHHDLASRPGPAEFDRPTRAVIARALPLEVAEYVFRAVGGPQGKETVI
jgi:hypothetical protein